MIQSHFSKTSLLRSSGITKPILLLLAPFRRLFRGILSSGDGDVRRSEGTSEIRLFTTDMILFQKDFGGRKLMGQK